LTIPWNFFKVDLPKRFRLPLEFLVGVHDDHATVVEILMCPNQCTDDDFKKVRDVLGLPPLDIP
jgi:hypothetical protein